jgi:hypothetical protein
MKKLLILALVLFGLGSFATSVAAAEGVTVRNIVQVQNDSTPQSSFEVKITEITKVNGADKTRFSFEPVSVINPQNIAYWKVRLYCQEKIDIRVNELDKNVCNKAVRVEPGTADKFSLLFSNPTGKTTPFSFKLKAYDKDGNWLHSEKKSFQWK